jgi:hypothetical protein
MIRAAGTTEDHARRGGKFVESYGRVLSHMGDKASVGIRVSSKIPKHVGFALRGLQGAD